MAKKGSKESSQGIITYIRTLAPLAYDVFTAWRDRPKWEQIMADLELVAQENEKLRKRSVLLTAFLGALFLWNAVLTYFLFAR